MRVPTKTVKRARSLRRTMSPPEVRLWLRVRERVDGRPVIHRQYPFGPYILDFYCPTLKLAIEVDGGAHGLPQQAAHDERRDGWLASQGVETWSLTAAALMRDPDEVAEGLWEAIMDRARALLG